MNTEHNTLFLRLSGPMQSWGTSSRFQLRRTDAYPSKSAVLGLLLCAKGVGRGDSEEELKALTPLRMGVRVDRGGTLDWDYHTAGAKIGIRKAEGGIKETASTHKPETLLSRRQYLYDASFLVALQGGCDTVACYAGHLLNPVWPVFLGRKCCVPAEPVFAGTGYFGSLTDALASVRWHPRINSVDRDDWGTTRTLAIYAEHPPGPPPRTNARLVYDVPKVFGYYSHLARWVVQNHVTVTVGEPTQKLPLEPYPRRVDYNSPQWEAARASRLKLDHGLCVFCKSPADEVHHASYENVGHETDADLRSLCKVCHDACTMLEYGHDMQAHRVDPSDPAQRQTILRQIKRNVAEQRLGQRRELLRTARIARRDFFDAASAASEGGR
ncbi:MAG TPA: type I-E CRISPR-associated protein Cas5/CasD [Terriglobia bacterium]|nr:type I-E CRISPR-associated protein Cas5/CasD [Terriglobia bacterium]